MRKLLTMLAVSGALVAGFAAPAQAAPTPGSGGTGFGSAPCVKVLSTPHRLTVRCGYITTVYRWDPRTRRWVPLGKYSTRR